jgi:hypothetical protein
MSEKKASSTLDFMAGMLLFGFVMMMFDRPKKKAKKSFWPFS